MASNTPPSPMSIDPDPTPSAIGPSSPSCPFGKICTVTAPAVAAATFSAKILTAWLIRLSSDEACASFKVSAAGAGVANVAPNRQNNEAVQRIASFLMVSPPAMDRPRSHQPGRRDGRSIGRSSPGHS